MIPLVKVNSGDPNDGKVGAVIGTYLRNDSDSTILIVAFTHDGSIREYRSHRVTFVGWKSPVGLGL